MLHDPEDMTPEELEAELAEHEYLAREVPRCHERAVRDQYRERKRELRRLASQAKRITFGDDDFRYSRDRS